MTLPSRPFTSRQFASRRFVSACACLVMVIAGLHLTGCGSDSPPTGPTPVVLLDTTVTLAQGVTCNIGYVGAEFTGGAGKTVAISANGPASLTPAFILYAPDFATQLAASSARGAGAASLTFALTQSGLHHLSVCDMNGVAGALRITVQQQ
jgi:hypothetical protein